MIKMLLLLMNKLMMLLALMLILRQSHALLLLLMMMLMLLPNCPIAHLPTSGLLESKMSRDQLQSCVQILRSFHLLRSSCVV